MSLAQTKELSLSRLEYETIRLLNRGSVVVFTRGRRGSGKTDMNLLLAEIGYKYAGIELVASNIRIISSPYPHEHITNLEDLESWCKNHRTRKLFILDEAGKSLRRRTPMSSLNIELIDKLQILRKYRLSLFLIAPSDVYVDRTAFGSDVLDVLIDKPFFNNQKYANWFDMQEDEEYQFSDIPRAKTIFDTFDVAPFGKTSPTKIPKFADADLAQLWKWTEGKPLKDLGMDRKTFHRILRKFLKETLAKKCDT